MSRRKRRRAPDNKISLGAILSQETEAMALDHARTRARAKVTSGERSTSDWLVPPLGVFRDKYPDLFELWQLVMSQICREWQEAQALYNEIPLALHDASLPIPLSPLQVQEQQEKAVGEIRNKLEKTIRIWWALGGVDEVHARSLMQHLDDPKGHQPLTGQHVWPQIPESELARVRQVWTKRAGNKGTHIKTKALRGDGAHTSSKYAVLSEVLNVNCGYDIPPRTLEDWHLRPYRNRGRG